jgi:hypothetical protein
MPMSKITFRGGAVWFEDSPEETYFSPIGFKELKIAQTTTTRAAGQRIGIRLFLPGFADSFGALGAQFTPLEQNETMIRVAYNQPKKYMAVSSGLPESFADVVLMQAEKDLTANKSLGSGVLLFDRARYDNAHSTSFIFRILTRSVLLLLSSETPQTSETVLELVNDVLKEAVKNTSRK